MERGSFVGWLSVVSDPACALQSFFDFRGSKRVLHQCTSKDFGLAPFSVSPYCFNTFPTQRFRILNEMTHPPAFDEDQRIVISICIPTYNRAELLRRCLNWLLPQTQGKPVDVVVIDNASSDHTGDVVQEFMQKYPSLRYFRNSTNLGFSGNQAKCVEYSRGKYTAVLCDDDVYTPNAIDTMLPVLSKGDYSFVALNYYAFTSDPKRVHHVTEAPEKDFQSDDAYEIWDFPSVGHYSGLVLNTSIAKSVLPSVWKAFTVEQYEHFRGVFGSVVVHTIKASNLPGYFIGKRIVGAGQPETVDYDSLRHLCIDTYQFFRNLKTAGLLTQQNIQRREDQTLQMLPKALIRHGGFVEPEELESIRSLLCSWFDGNPKFKKTERLLNWMRSGAFRFVLRAFARAYVSMRWLPRWWQSLRSSGR